MREKGLESGLGGVNRFLSLPHGAGSLVSGDRSAYLYLYIKNPPLFEKKTRT